MADVKISGLPSSAGVADATLLPTVSAAIVTEKATGLQLKTYIRTGVSVPGFTVLLSGSGTYTTPTDANGNLPTRLEVKLLGGGGGGAGSGSAPGSGGNGGNTTFAALTAPGGIGAVGLTGGAGGSPSTGDANYPGGRGSDAANYTFVAGGLGGSTQYGLAPLNPGSGTTQNALANTGCGGGGGAADATGGAGAGGGAGGQTFNRITSPAASYAYAVGAGGTAGSAGGGTAPKAGGVGGSGRIEITAYWV